MDKLFVDFKKTKAEFINSGLDKLYFNKIVFIGGGECIYTRGKYFATLIELSNYLSNLILQEKELRIAALELIRELIPTKTSQLVNDINFIGSLELNQSVQNKVDKVEGKGLSSEDFTLELKTKLDSLLNYNDEEISKLVSLLREDLNTLVEGDTSSAIKSFNDITAFLEGIEDSESLDSILASLEELINNIYVPTLLNLLSEDEEHRTVTDLEKNTWNSKQDTISDIDTIRNNALLATTALQLVPSEYVTEQELTIKDYVTTTTLLNNYLPLSGGTLHNSLDITKESTIYAAFKINDVTSNTFHAFHNPGFTHPRSTAISYYLDGLHIGSLAVNTTPMFIDSAINIHKIWHEGNDGEGSGLDADTLDGLLGNRYLHSVSSINNQDFNVVNGIDSNGNCNYNTNYTLTADFLQTNSPYPYGMLTSLNCNAAGMEFATNGPLGYSTELKFRKRWLKNLSSWKTVAFTDSNVASATKLATPVKLWGNDFDGSSDISSHLIIANNYYLGFKDSTGANFGIMTLDSNNNVILGERSAQYKFNTNIDGYNIYFKYGELNTTGLILNSLGSVGIGTTTPEYKLDVAGNTRILGSSNLPLYLVNPNGNESSIAYVSKSGTRWTAGLGTGSLIDTFGVWSDTYGGNVLVLANSGYMGLGTNTPDSKLHVISKSTNNLAKFKAEGAIGVITFEGNGTYGCRLDIKNSDNSKVVASIDYNGIISSVISLTSSLEIKGLTPYIDFHFNNSTSDYTSRIIELAQGTLTCINHWNILGNSSVTGTLQANHYLFMNKGGEGIYLHDEGISWKDASNAYVTELIRFDKTGRTSFGANALVKNNVSLQGYKTDGTIANLIYINASNHVVVGLNIPINLLGSTVITGDLTVTGSINNVVGSITVTDILVVDVMPDSPNATTLYLIPE